MSLFFFKTSVGSCFIHFDAPVVVRAGQKRGTGNLKMFQNVVNLLFIVMNDDAPKPQNDCI